jgi:hypothetical protein
VELYLLSPNTPPWRGVLLKHRDNFTLHFDRTRYNQNVKRNLELRDAAETDEYVVVMNTPFLTELKGEGKVKVVPVFS